MLKQHFHALVLAFQFLTRIPVYKVFPIASSVAPPRVAGKALLYYPVVGVVIGACITFLPFLIVEYGLLINTQLQAALVLVVWVWITGGLHLDGLGDSADAWLGGFGDKQRTLDIMKDPTCGPSAVVVLVLTLLLKWIALNLLIQQAYEVPLLWLMLVLVPMVARLQVMMLVIQTPYVRSQGLGEQLKNQAQKIWVWCWFVATLSFMLYQHLELTIAVIVVVGLAYFKMRSLMVQRIDGWTGDTAGASIEMVELAMLLVLAIATPFLI